MVGVSVSAWAVLGLDYSGWTQAPGEPYLCWEGVERTAMISTGSSEMEKKFLIKGADEIMEGHNP